MTVGGDAAADDDEDLCSNSGNRSVIVMIMRLRCRW